MTPVVLQGLIIGLSVAAPVGPIGVLCVRRTLTQGRWTGFVSGLGAATADALYASVAGFGLSVVSGFLVDQQVWLRVFGGAYLCYLGVRAFFDAPDVAVEAEGNPRLLGAYGSAFALTLGNPMTMLSFVGIFAGLGLTTAGGDHRAAAALVLSVFAGSVLWWFGLNGTASLLRERFDVGALRWVNRVSGVIVSGFGIAALVSAL